MLDLQTNIKNKNNTLISDQTSHFLPSFFPIFLFRRTIPLTCMCNVSLHQLRKHETRVYDNQPKAFYQLFNIRVYNLSVSDFFFFRLSNSRVVKLPSNHRLRLPRSSMKSPGKNHKNQIAVKHHPSPCLRLQDRQNRPGGGKHVVNTCAAHHPVNKWVMCVRRKQEAPV